MKKSSNQSRLFFRRFQSFLFIGDGSERFPAIQRAILFTFGMALTAAIYLIFWHHITTPSRAEMQDNEKPSRHLTARDIANANPLVRRGFSVSRAVDIFRTTREDQRDFLTIYMRNDLPDYISKADIQLIEHSFRTFHEEKSAVAGNFKRGMLYFFLAVTETIWLVEGNSIDSSTVAAHWTESVSNLRRAGAIGREFSDEFESILKSVDSDSNGQFTSSELRQIILERE